VENRKRDLQSKPTTFAGLEERDGLEKMCSQNSILVRDPEKSTEKKHQSKSQQRGMILEGGRARGK